MDKMGGRDVLGGRHFPTTVIGTPKRKHEPKTEARANNPRLK